MTAMRGMFPTRSHSMKLAIAVIAGSILYGLFKSSAGPWLLLTPGKVVGSFAVWEVLTYCFIETRPAGVLFSALILWNTGGQLESSWGGKTVLAYAIGVTTLAGIFTVATWPLWGMAIGDDPRAGAMMGFAGGSVMAGTVWVALGWSYGKRQMNFWGLPLSGNGFAFIGILMMVLTAVLEHWVLVIPEAFALALAFVYVRYGTPFNFVTRFRAWSLQRKLKGRSKHLRVVEKDRNVGGGSDHYLH